VAPISVYLFPRRIKAWRQVVAVVRCNGTSAHTSSWDGLSLVALFPVLSSQMLLATCWPRQTEPERFVVVQNVTRLKQRSPCTHTRFPRVVYDGYRTDKLCRWLCKETRSYVLPSAWHCFAPVTVYFHSKVTRYSLHFFSLLWLIFWFIFDRLFYLKYVFKYIIL
jgi:hypothetical protein